MDADELALTVIRRGATALVVAAGDLTAFTCGRLADAVAEAVEEGTSTVELDLSEVRFIDSSGIQCMVRARRMALDHRGARVRVTGMSQVVQRVLEVTGLVEVLAGDEPV